MFLAAATLFSLQPPAECAACMAEQSAAEKPAAYVYETAAEAAVGTRLGYFIADSSEETDDQQDQAPQLGEVSLMLQNPELPNGCEVTSLAMLLSSTGSYADKMELYESYLPRRAFTSRNGVRYAPSPEDAYIGDAASSTGGWYCFEGPILAAGNTWLEARGLPWRLENLTGITQEQMEEYLNQGHPLIVWVTLHYQRPRTVGYTWMLPNGTVYTPYSNLHCVVLTGWDGGNYRVADPLYGWQSVSPADFWSAFEGMGSRALTLSPDVK